MVSASALINTILTQMQEYVKEGALKDIQSRDERLHGLKISPHTLRRTCGTDMINRGAPVEMVKEKLGHAKVDTTLQCYAQIGTEAVRDADRRYGAA